MGYPLKLVQAKEHLFVRWEEEDGERFNIEATTVGFTARDDEHYRHWPKPISDDEVRRGMFLRNLTPNEELATFLRERGLCWLDNLRTAAALEAFAHAAQLGPNLPGVQCSWAIATVLHRMVEEVGRDALLSCEAPDEVNLPAPRTPWEHAVHDLASDYLKRILKIHRSHTQVGGPREAQLECQREGAMR